MPYLVKLLAKKAAQTDFTPIGEFLSSAELMGSRGRARLYGRPEPEGRDYDYVRFTDDSEEQQKLMALLRKLNGFRLKDRPGGFLTASGQNMDLSVYPTAKKQDIHKAWSLIEQGYSKDDAWAQVEAEKTASDYTLLHYSKNKYDELRPLSYTDLIKTRTAGRWKDQPEKAEEYVKARKKFEKALHKRLSEKGISTDRDRSFLYATLAGYENLGKPDQQRHEVRLTPEIIEQSFFDVIGDGKARVVFGQKGLQQALKRWQKAQDNGSLTASDYMGMEISPRVEIMTPLTLKPDA